MCFFNWITESVLYPQPVTWHACVPTGISDLWTSILCLFSVWDVLNDLWHSSQRNDCTFDVVALMVGFKQLAMCLALFDLWEIIFPQLGQLQILCGFVQCFWAYFAFTNIFPQVLQRCVWEPFSLSIWPILTLFSRISSIILVIGFSSFENVSMTSDLSISDLPIFGGVKNFLFSLGHCLRIHFCLLQYKDTK